MVTEKKAIEAATVVAQFCREQHGCQNCIFRKHGGDYWKCQISAFDLQDIIDNKQAKKNKWGYI